MALGNGMALPKIRADRVMGWRASTPLLVIIGENLRLDEVARAEQIGDRTRFAHRT